MIGTIIGDICGSPYEFTGLKLMDAPLKNKLASFTDDTVCTIATMDWINEGMEKSYAHYLMKWGWKYPNPKGNYGASFKDWLSRGKAISLLEGDDKFAPPYDSFGNGSAMRVSPVAIKFRKDLNSALEYAKQSSIVTHDHPEGIKGAQATTMALILAYQKYPKDYIRKEIQSVFGYDMAFKLNDIRPHYKWNETCQDSVPQAIACFLEASSFEGTLKNCISLGGDADTLCAIAGGIAEAYYGVPKNLISWGLKKLPLEMNQTLKTFYNESIK